MKPGGRSIFRYILPWVPELHCVIVALISSGYYIDKSYMSSGHNGAKQLAWALSIVNVISAND